MKLLAVAFTFCTFYFFNYNTNGQHFDYPNLFYTPIKFDYSIRGGFNISECMKELLTCWELVRGDNICHEAISQTGKRYGERYRESVCSYMKDLCHDMYGDLDVAWFKYTMFENYCNWRNIET